MLAAAVILAAVSAVQNWIGLGLAVLLVAYLVAVLVVPERF